MVQDVVINKMMPHDIEAEKSILGAIFIDNRNYDEVAEVIKSGDFYREGHQLVYQAMETLLEDAIPVDIITLKNELLKTGKLEKSGGIPYLTSLLDGVPKSLNVRHYADIIKSHSMLRELIVACDNTIARCLSRNEDSRDIIDSAEKEIFKIAGDTVGEGFVRLKKVADGSMDLLEKLVAAKESITGVASGFTELDDMTAGFQDSDLIIIAARPSMGKTSFAMNVAQYVGINTDKSVGIFSLEMSKEQLFLRLLCSEAMIDLGRLRTGHIGKKEWDKLAKAMDKLSKANIFIDDTPGISLMEMKAKARRLQMRSGLDLIIVDYLQLMIARGRFESKNQEVTYLSQGLKNLAKELNIPVIALSQLSRAPEQRTDHRPKLSDLRESGSIEQDADVVAFIYRDEVYNQDNNENAGTAELIISKQRNGPTGVVNLAFLKEFTRFENLARVSEF